MLFLFRFSNLIVIFFTFCSVGFAQDANFYEDRKGGFYWYQDEMAVEDGIYFQMPEPDNFSYEQLWNMNPQKLAEIVEQRKIIAIQTTSVEDAKKYLEVQDVAKRKSMAFAGVMGIASQMTPKLSRQYVTSMSNSTKQAYLDNKNQNLEKTISSAADSFALMVFESPGCSYCETQRPIIEEFKFNYGWKVRHLDIDKYRSLADQYGIDMTPSILILSKENRQAMPISTGVISISELEKRVMRAIRYLAGEAQPEEWFDDQKMSDPLKFIQKKGRVER